MSTQRDLFDAAREAKTRAIDQVEANADDRWTDAALTIVRQLAATREEFTTDDIWAALKRAGHRGPREPRAMGAVMRRARLAKIARPINRVRGSISTVNHARPLRVWCRW